MLSSLFDEAGADNVEGSYGTRPDLPARQADRRRRGRSSRTSAAEDGKPLEVYTVYARHRGTGAPRRDQPLRRHPRGRLAKLFETDLADTVVGPMSFNDEGDPENASETVYMAQGGAWTFKETKALE